THGGPAGGGRPPHALPKLDVVGSNPIARSARLTDRNCPAAFSFVLPGTCGERVRMSAAVRIARGWQRDTLTLSSWCKLWCRPGSACVIGPGRPSRARLLAGVQVQGWQCCQSAPDVQELRVSAPRGSGFVTVFLKTVPIGHALLPL